MNTTKRLAAIIAIPHYQNRLLLTRTKRGKKARGEGGSGGDEAGNVSCGDVCTTTALYMSQSYSTAIRRRHNGGGREAFDRFRSQKLEFTEPGMLENESFQLPSPPPP